MTATRPDLAIRPQTQIVETFSLRRGVFSSGLPDGSTRLVAWPHAGTLPAAALNRPVLQALARGVLSTGQLALAVGAETPGRRAEIARIVGDLREAGWLRVTLTLEGRPLYTVDPLAPPPADPVPPGPDVLSHFTVLRREQADLLVESPRSWCEIRLHAPELAAIVAGAPPGSEGGARLWADLARGGFLTTAGGEEDTELRFRQWGPHELLFHDRSRLRHRGYFGDNFGGTFWAREEFEPLPARPEPFGGPVIGLPMPDLAELRRTDPTLTEVLENRRSLRHYDDEHPIRLDQLGEFLYRSGRTRLVRERDGVEYSSRPYPSGGSVYELEMYVLVRRADGLEPGLYHYRSIEHALERVAGPEDRAVRKLYTTAGHGSAEGVPPQVMVIVSARFGRLMWKYTSMGYALILKHVGVLYQTMYCVATAIGLAPCGLGSGDSVAFAEATGRDRFTESSVGEFLLGSRAEESVSLTQGTFTQSSSTRSAVTSAPARLELRPDAHPVTVGTALWILGPTGSHRIGDAGLGRWLDRLTPLLDGTRTLDEITGRLAPEAREQVAVLLRALVRRGIVRECEGPSPVGAPPDPLIGLLGYFCADPAERADRLRATPLLITGGGALAEAVGAAAASGGLRLHRRPGGDLLTLTSAADPGRPLIQAKEHEGEIWIGTDVESAGYRHRLPPASERELGPEREPARERVGETSGPARRVAANHLLNAAVRILTGLPTGLVPETVEVFPAGRITAVRHRCRPHPFVSAVERVLSDEPGVSVKTTTQQEFSRSAIRWVDDRFGILGTLWDADIPQLPLHVYATQVADPVGLRGSSTAVAVGYGGDLESARCAAALHGVASYAAAMIDPRRVRGQLSEAFCRPGEPRPDALARLRDDPSAARVAGYEPDQGRPVWVPADRAFPVLRPGGADRAAWGLAAGYTADQAVLSGLLSQARRLVLEALAHTAPTPRAVPVEGSAERRYRQLCTLAGEVRVTDLTGLLGLAAVAVEVGGHLVVECGTQTSDALDRALERALLHAQVGPGGVPGGEPCGGPPKSSQPAEQARRITRVLRDRGFTVQVVPLDHDPQVTMVIPAPVQVVVTDAAL